MLQGLGRAEAVQGEVVHAYRVTAGADGRVLVNGTNIDELLTEGWLRELIQRGVHYVWYHSYRPMGPKPNFQLKKIASILSENLRKSPYPLEPI